MSASRRSVPVFRVGDWVSFRYGMRGMKAQIIEDRGRLGLNGRRIYRLRIDRVDPTTGEPTSFEMPEDYLEATTAPTP